MKRLILLALLVATPLAAADDDKIGKRVVTLETQMRAVQRKVFPGGDPRFFTPEIASDPVAAPVEPTGTPATSALADLTARVDSLERAQRQLTGGVEELQNRLRVLDEAVTRAKGDTEFRLSAIEARAAPAPVAAAPEPVPEAVAPPAKPGRPLKPTPVKPDPEPEAPAAPPTAAEIEASWRAAYALYVAKDYARAATAITDFLAANPKAARASNAQYWLGRTYMAQSKFTQAAKAFLDGYQKYPKGDRAPDSLLWLGNALTALKKPDQACRALNELQSVYGEKLTPALTDAAAKSRTAAKCEG